MSEETLASLLDLAAASDLHARLRARTGGEQVLTLNASAVERLTTPCVQVLLAAASHGAGIRVVAPSAAFTEGIAMLGLQSSTAGWIVP